MRPNEHEHDYDVADLQTVIDQSAHKVTGYVICRTCGEVKPFICDEARLNKS